MSVSWATDPVKLVDIKEIIREHLLESCFIFPRLYLSFLVLDGYWKRVQPPQR